MENIKEFVIKMIKGMVVGVATITAGAGTFAILLGIYDRCMEIISNPFKNFKDNLKYIFPIIVGILISVLIFGQFVIFCLNEYASYTRCVFLGIIIGGVPTLIGFANRKGFKKRYLISMGIALIITVLLTGVANNTKAGTTVEYLSKTELVVYGAIYSFGAVMPGMTTIHILIFMGVLPTIMSGFYSLNFEIIIPFAVGYIIIALTTANLITYLFNRFYGLTYYAIIGFSITSLVMFIPKFTTFLETIIGVMLIIFSTIMMYLITKLEKSHTKEETKG